MPTSDGGGVNGNPPLETDADQAKDDERDKFSLGDEEDAEFDEDDEFGEDADNEEDANDDSPKIELNMQEEEGGGRNFRKS